MMLIWQEVAGGLPEPAVPTPTDGWATRFFETCVVLRTRADRLALNRLVRRLREPGVVLALRDGNGVPTPCRLVRADGTQRVLLAFAVVNPAPV